MCMYTCTLRQGLSVCAPTIVNPLPGVYLPPTANTMIVEKLLLQRRNTEYRGGREKGREGEREGGRERGREGEREGGREGEPRRTIWSCSSVRETCPFQSEMTLSME